ncbi:PAS domain-containing protein [Hoeflea sp.]|uniref:PAS domain-containing protein n=1 Tax=Hoeflea sp. TaxID=1940281 RepID=UPI003747B1B6
MTDSRATLHDVLAAFKQAEADLACAIDAGETEQIHRAELRLSQVHFAVCRYPSQTPAELSAQLRFLLDRLINQTGASHESVDYRELCDMLTNRLEREIGTPWERRGADPVDAPSQVHYHDPLDSLSVSDLVSQSADRVSIISTDYRYLRTSIGNTKFYEKDQQSILGRHLAEIIGTTRFESRARARLDACFSGARQDYSHILEIDGESRVMNCRMSPVRDRHNALIGAQVTMCDVTSLYHGETSLIPCAEMVSRLDTTIRKRA